MKTTSTAVPATGVRFSLCDKNGQEIGRAFLYIMHNNLHERPFGLIEDIFIEEAFRGSGHGTDLIKKLIQEAKKHKCYKLIATSRHAREQVHKLYHDLGFKNHGLELRMTF